MYVRVQKVGLSIMNHGYYSISRSNIGIYLLVESTDNFFFLCKYHSSGKISVIFFLSFDFIKGDRLRLYQYCIIRVGINIYTRM